MISKFDRSNTPEALAPSVDAQKRTEPIETPRNTRTETSPIVFVVDDDPMMAGMIGAAVGGAGYRVHVFTDGTEAHALAVNLRPDLLLVDLTMPQLSGAETIARLRELKPTLPVLVISGLSKNEARAVAPEANAFLEKPFQFSALLRALTDLQAL